MSHSSFVSLPVPFLLLPLLLLLLVLSFDPNFPSSSLTIAGGDPTIRTGDDETNDEQYHECEVRRRRGEGWTVVMDDDDEEEAEEDSEDA